MSYNSNPYASRPQYNGGNEVANSGTGGYNKPPPSNFNSYGGAPPGGGYRGRSNYSSGSRGGYGQSSYSSSSQGSSRGGSYRQNSYGRQDNGAGQQQEYTNMKYEDFKLDVKTDWSKIQLKALVNDFKQEPIEEIVKKRAETSVVVEGEGILVKPFYNFANGSLPREILNLVTHQGWITPTPIQSEAIPLSMSGRDVVGIAQTGSGKTAAFILPSIINILNLHGNRRDGPYVACIVPTRELAMQVYEVAKIFCKPLNISCVCVYGGASKHSQRNELNDGCNIIIATPGRLLDFINNGTIKMQSVGMCVLDEADRMLDMGFEPQIRDVMSTIRPDRQILMFSATWPKEVRNLAETFLRKYTKVKIGSTDLYANHAIKQNVTILDEADKEKNLYDLLCKIVSEKNNKTIIFFETKRKTDTITFLLKKQGWPVAAIHGNKDQRERERVLADFKAGRFIILLATDVAARGLDVSDIYFVINYDYPMTSEDYVHRIGRTGRAGNKGTSHTFFTSSNSGKAKELVNILKESKQEVPADLLEMSYTSMSKGGRYGKKNYNGGQKRMSSGDYDQADKRFKSNYGSSNPYAPRGARPSYGNSRGGYERRYQRGSGSRY